MIVSFLLLFLASAWIIYVYLDRYKYFTGPTGKVVTRAGVDELVNPAPVPKVTSGGILGASRVHTVHPVSPPTPPVTGGVPIDTAAQALVKEPVKEELDEEEQGILQEEETGSDDKEQDEEEPIDDGLEDTAHDETDNFFETGEPESGEDSELSEGDPEENDQENDEGEKGSDGSGDLLGYESEGDLPDTMELTNSSVDNRRLFESATSTTTLSAPIVTNWLNTVGLNVVENPDDEISLTSIDEESEVDYTSYDLDKVMAEDENRVDKKTSAFTVHYAHRDLSLSEYASQFRTLREGALAIRREMDRSSSLEYVSQMAADYVRYVGTIGLTQDNNVSNLMQTSFVEDLSSTDSSSNEPSFSSAKKYADLFSQMLDSHNGGHALEIS